MHRRIVLSLLAAALVAAILPAGASAQNKNSAGKQRVRVVAIPISIYKKGELKQEKLDEFVYIERLTVKENKEEQQILSIRTVDDAPLALAILIQEDLTSEFNLQLADIAKFIRNLPRGSRVMVAYLRGGTLDIRQRFTDDRELAAKSLRIVSSSEIAAPRNPYDGLIEALNRFDALPAGRRAVIMFSDGLDPANGLDLSSSTQSPDLERGILRAQRKSVSVFTIYSPASLTANGSSLRVLYGQSSLGRLADETGGRAFFQGSAAPVSVLPFFKDIGNLLNRQFLLTYLSTHMKRGYYRVEVTSSNPEVKVEHPRGYYYR